MIGCSTVLFKRSTVARFSFLTSEETRCTVYRLHFFVLCIKKNCLTPEKFGWMCSQDVPLSKFLWDCCWFCVDFPEVCVWPFWPPLSLCRWWAVWTPTPAGTVLRCGCRGPDKRSSRTWHPWSGSSWSSSTSRLATSPPESSSTETVSQRASSDRYFSPPVFCRALKSPAYCSLCCVLADWVTAVIIKTPLFTVGLTKKYVFCRIGWIIKLYLFCYML